jgi:hypothetical protein
MVSLKYKFFPLLLILFFIVAIYDYERCRTRFDYHQKGNVKSINHNIINLITLGCGEYVQQHQCKKAHWYLKMQFPNCAMSLILLLKLEKWYASSILFLIYKYKVIYFCSFQLMDIFTKLPWWGC